MLCKEAGGSGANAGPRPAARGGSAHCIMAARLRLRRGSRRPPPPPARGLLRGGRGAGARAALPAPLTPLSAASSPPRQRRSGRGGAGWRGAGLPSAPRRPLCPVQRGPARPPPLPAAPPPLCRGEEEEAPLQRPAVHQT
ncbi:atherin-like [Neopelma chrysocephalum]|uniref:atherin-like n=1 Tax=Neopelma chrysocephalum TaxID=114329 RepID=UPI000FCD106A|nr:atherin-like [Neopelma chrysocephalum]